MGLDMYAFSTKAKPKTEVDFETKNFEPQDEVAYWRKHPNLHGWMQSLYESKGGTSPDFNGDCVVLTLNDLEDLEHDIKQNDLPDTSGFFFGESANNDEENEIDLLFVAKAREAIAEGKTVYYTSWW
jgi:hypothetical protein